jgi:hypothetical protein
MKQWSALLLEELARWPSVTVRRMFGMVVCYHNKKIFAALPRTKSFDPANAVAFKLYRTNAATAKLLHSDDRIGAAEDKKTGWISFALNTARDLNVALKWFDRAYRSCAR